MKQIQVYIRIAKNKTKGHKVAISMKPNPATLFKIEEGGWQTALPTIRFGVKINVPDDAFDFNSTIKEEIYLNVLKKDIK